jgi:hypothetical protein
MERISRLIAAFALLGTAACTDGPLAPRLSPGPESRSRASKPTAAASGAPVIRLWCVGSIRADAPPPLYVVDGRETASIEALDTSTIDTIEVINSTEAVARYGSRAATGAVLITTRSPGRRSGT